MFSENSVIDITQPCRYSVAVGIEKGYIPDKNLWATSKTNNARGPSYARLRGWKGDILFEQRILIIVLLHFEVYFCQESVQNLTFLEIDHSGNLNICI